MSQLSTAEDNKKDTKGSGLFAYFVMGFIAFILLLVYIYGRNGDGLPL
ncbi:MAG: hypothetical protein ACPG19_09990 [Saprospiraceae bacterium]